MEVKPGYKWTDVGIIPEDWATVTIDQVCDVRVGRDLLAERFSLLDDPTYRFPVYSNTVTNEGLYGFYSSPEYEGESVTVVGRGVGLGTAFARTGGYGAIGRLLVLLPDHRVNARFLATYINQRVSIFFETGGIPQLTGVQFSKYRVALPPFSEQRAIAAALSDVDALLGGLGRLIAKKRDLKQAAMQQLLTGQTRLPGFSGEWEQKRLGDHLTFLKNGVNSRAELTNEGQVKYLHYGDIHGATGLLLNPSMTAMPHLSISKASRLDRLSNGDLVFADASEDMEGVGKSVELHNIAQADVVSGLHTIAVRFDKEVLADGFKAYLQFIPVFRQHLRRLAAGTKVFATNRAFIASAEIKLPSTREQRAIATVLSDMDAEIAALEVRRAKSRDLKQAMMQELLTGRTRLI